MDVFRRFAVFTLARDASLVAFTAGMLMVAFSFAPALALGIGAGVALVFSILLALRGMFLTDDRLLRSEVWTVLQPEERPAGERGRQCAREDLRDLLWRFSKSAAACAIALYVFSLLMSLGGTDPGAAVLTASLH